MIKTAFWLILISQYPYPGQLPLPANPFTPSIDPKSVTGVNQVGQPLVDPLVSPLPPHHDDTSVVYPMGIPGTCGFYSYPDLTGEIHEGIQWMGFDGKWYHISQQK